ncbi:hypothetical protein [Sphingomonas aerophila]|uniref:Uncharacterized protein n=1 Tax=Sphingomonas aerophila TaxID=1344948 RepID=A0A7W9BFN9_9SPHN|nr:hypothetical protein [Sphingomonas aerophila]MBB5716379.1 hypothetical protein [Sphingomonas aerophila]
MRRLGLPPAATVVAVPGAAQGVGPQADMDAGRHDRSPASLDLLGIMPKLKA